MIRGGIQQLDFVVRQEILALSRDLGYGDMSMILHFQLLQPELPRVVVN